MRSLHRIAHGIVPSRPRLLLDFAKGEYWLRGRRYANLSDVLTLTRATAAWLEVNGVLTQFGAAQPRINEFGLKIEGQKVNLLINGQAVGATGTTTPPNNWGQGQPFGGVSILAWNSGIDAKGYGYTQFRVSGTPTFSNRLLPVPSLTRMTVVAGGQYSFSYNARLVSAAGTYGGLIQVNYLWYDSGGVNISTTNGTMNTFGTTQIRFSDTVTAPAGAIQCFLRFDMANAPVPGVAVDFTIALGGCQFEAGVPTSYIPTTNGQVTRNGDSALVNNIADLLGSTRINLCTCFNANPQVTTNTVFTNATNSLATVGLVDDAIALAAAGLSAYGPNVFKVDNTLGDTDARFQVLGQVGAVGVPFTCSAYVRGGTGVMVTNGTGSGIPASATYVRRTYTTNSDAVSRTFNINVAVGQVMYVVLPQLQPGSVATDPIVVSGAQATAQDPFYAYSEATFPAAVSGTSPRTLAADLNGIASDLNTFGSFGSNTSFNMYNGVNVGVAFGTSFKSRNVKSISRFRSDGRLCTVDGVTPAGDALVHGVATRLIIGSGSAGVTISDGNFSIVELGGDISASHMQARTAP